MSELRTIIAQLDGLLTGDPTKAEHAARTHRSLDDPLAFIAETSSVPYPLSDGAYSSIVVSDDGEVLGLNASSCPAVKAQWREPEVQNTVGALERLLLTAVNAERLRAAHRESDFLGFC